MLRACTRTTSGYF